MHAKKYEGSKLDIKKIIKSKKFKNTAITILEILVVAGIIFGGLMFAQSKVSKDSSTATNNTGKNVSEEETKKDNKSNDYFIKINKKLKSVIIYQYSKDKKSKEQIKVFRSSIGNDVPDGKFKIGKKYSWLNIYQGWHKYNSELGSGIWIHSAIYGDKSDDRISKTSYEAIGKSKASGKSVILSAKDAAWIYEHCKENTEVSIAKGKKSDKLSVSPEPIASTYKYCGWDPTDPDKKNPYRKIKNGKIVKGLSTVTIEKGHEPNYRSNLIGLNKKGKNITGKLKYNQIDYSRVGTYKVKYKYKAPNGTKYSITQNIKVVDTTPPNIRCSKSLYTLEVKSESPDDINTDENVKSIVAMVRAGVSADESITDVQVYTLEKEQLRIDEKASVVVKAKDAYGNVGSCQVMCELKVKEEETTNSKEDKKEKTTTKKKVTKKKTTKKKTTKKKTTKEKTTTSNKTDKNQVETTKKSSEKESQTETTKVAE